MLRIKIADMKDISKISSVLAASWKTAYRGIVDDDYLDSLKSDHWVDFLVSGLKDKRIFSMIMENNQETIGAAILSKTEEERVACLMSFYLVPDKIGRGFGHDFYIWIEAELKNRGFSKCALDVLEKNKRAIRFYESHGFVDTKREIKATLGEHDYTCRVFEKTLR